MWCPSCLALEEHPVMSQMRWKYRTTAGPTSPSTERGKLKPPTASAECEKCGWIEIFTPKDLRMWPFFMKQAEKERKRLERKKEEENNKRTKDAEEGRD